MEFVLLWPVSETHSSKNIYTMNRKHKFCSTEGVLPSTFNGSVSGRHGQKTSYVKCHNKQLIFWPVMQLSD